MNLGERMANIARIEWELWGKTEINIFGYKIKTGKQEHYKSASWMVYRYWSVGCGIRTRNGQDREIPWSAAFISYVARMAGCGEDFPYHQSHSVYLNKFKDGNEFFNLVEINTQEFKIGDLVAYHRVNWDLTFKNMPNRFNSHCDIITKITPNYIEVIGGNVSHSVTKKIIPLKEGKIDLTRTKQNWFAHAQNMQYENS